MKTINFKRMLGLLLVVMSFAFTSSAFAGTCQAVNGGGGKSHANMCDRGVSWEFGRGYVCNYSCGGSDDTKKTMHDTYGA